jgi:toxin ParE1/3/4
MPMAKSNLKEYRLTVRARTDLEDIWRYTAQTWSANQAERYCTALERIFGVLLAMPEIARERDEFSPPVRIHVSGRHVIVYRVETDYLSIIRILGARQDWRELLKAII